MVDVRAALNRLKEDRTAEIIINRVFGGLRVDALAKCIVKDAESDKHGSSNSVDDDTNTVVIEEPIIYEGNDVIFGSQDCSQFKNGAYTGDISAEMIKKIGCKYILIGHSERRTIFNETDAVLKRKMSTFH